MNIQKQEDGRFIVVTNGGTIVAGPYAQIHYAKLAYPNARQGVGVTDTEWRLG